MRRRRWTVSLISWRAPDRLLAGRAPEEREWQRLRPSNRPDLRAGITIPARTKQRWQVPPNCAVGYRESSIWKLQKEDWELADLIPPEPMEAAILRFASRPSSNDAYAGCERCNEKDSPRLPRYR